MFVYNTPNNYSKVVVNGTDVSPDGPESILIINEGTGISITTDAITKTIIISADGGSGSNRECRINRILETNILYPKR